MNCSFFFFFSVHLAYKQRVPRLSFNPQRHDFFRSQHPFYLIQKLPNSSNSVLGQFFPPTCLNLPVCCGCRDLYCCPGFLQLFLEKLFTVTKSISSNWRSVTVLVFRERPFFGFTTCLPVTNEFQGPFC